MKSTIPFALIAAVLVESTAFAEEVLKSDLYNDLVAPILTAKCGACHGEEKQKGKLRLDSFEAILKGGTEGPSIVAG